MLTEIKERATGWIAWIIVIIISIPFVLWGVNEYFAGGSALNVAVVNGQEITQQQYRNALEERRGIARRMMGAQFDPDIVNSPEFRRAVLDDLIDRRLLDQHAEDAGFRVSDQQLADFITTSPQFQQDGRFDPGLYQQRLLAMGLTKAGYESYLRNEFVLQQMRDGLGGSSFVTDQDQTGLLTLAQETRVFDHAAIDPGSFSDEVEVSAEEIESRYEQNQDQYQSPEMVKIQYVRLAVDDLLEEAEVSDEDIEQFYENNRDLYKTAEQRTASHILLTLDEDAGDDVVQQTLVKAIELADRARDGEDFGELAREHSQDPGSAAIGGDLGQIERGLMVKPFEDVLFSMTEGEISDPVKTRYGYHVIKLTELLPGQGKELDEVRDQIREEEKRRAAEGLFVDRAETFRNLVFEQPESLDAVVEELGLEISESDWFSLDSGEGVASNPIVRETAFSDDVFIENLNSETVELDINTLIALRKLESKPAAVRPLDEVSDEIEQTIRQEKTRALAADAGSRILAELEDGGDWAALTTENQLVSRQSTQTRLMANPDTPIAVSKEVFRTAPTGSGPAFGSVALPDGSVVLYRIEEVRPGVSDDAEESTMQQISTSLDRRRGIDYFASYQSGLRDTAKIEVFQENL